MTEQPMASSEFVLEIRTAPARKRVLGGLITLVTGVLSMGDPGTVQNPGSRRFVVRKLMTGEVVAAIDEPIGDDENVTLNTLRGDLARMSADQFLDTWGD